MSDGARTLPLAEEHLLLGAVMAETCGAMAPASYGADTDAEDDALSAACGVCDLSFAHVLLVSGTGARALFEAAWAGRRLAVGECAFGAVLAGDGALVSAPLALRTGDAEYLLLDASPRWEALLGWLGWLAGLETGGSPAFPEARVSDETGSLVPLALSGPRAREVAADYVHGDEALPGAGVVASLHLDRILAICAAPAEGSLLALVPPAWARVLWRSLMSFPIAAPVGTAALGRHAAGRYGWAGLLDGTDRVAPGRRALSEWGLLRDETDFVGARALAEEATR